MLYLNLLGHLLFFFLGFLLCSIIVSGKVDDIRREMECQKRLIEAYRAKAEWHEHDCP